MVNPEFNQWVVIEFIGNVNSAFKKYVEQDDVLKEVTNFVDSIPHNELLKLYGKTDLQLLVLAYSAIAPGNLPGKFFEYLASGNPILAIGPINGDAADVLKQTKAGEIFERTDDGGIKQSIMKFYFDWKAGKGNDARDVSLYTRKALTERLSSLLQNL
jgi:hypothetical protein